MSNSKFYGESQTTVCVMNQCVANIVMLFTRSAVLTMKRQLDTAKIVDYTQHQAPVRIDLEDASSDDDKNK